MGRVINRGARRADVGLNLDGLEWTETPEGYLSPDLPEERVERYVRNFDGFERYEVEVVVGAEDESNRSSAAAGPVETPATPAGPTTRRRSSGR